jgi:enterochelin esterase-like enzyme
MKWKMLLIAALLLIISGLAACQSIEDPQIEDVPSSVVSTTEQKTSEEFVTMGSQCKNFSIESSILEAELTIEIALPNSQSARDEGNLNSIYLLDANYFFDDKEGTLDFLLERGPGMTHIVQSLMDEKKIPASVLIGIDYSENQRIQFTSLNVDDFYQFFTDELIPQIESRCPVNQSSFDRLLFGYSGSAHFSTYALLKDVILGVETFNKVISISGVYEPTSSAFQLEEALGESASTQGFGGKSMFIAIGSQDPKSELLNDHRIFAEKLVDRNYNNFRLLSKEFEGKGHYDIPEIAFEEALIWIYAQ